MVVQEEDAVTMAAAAAAVDSTTPGATAVPDTTPIPKSAPSPTVLMFREFATRLDDKYDRLERLIKLSRDVTIDSKRIIFQLHRVSSDPSALEKAVERLHFIRERFLHKMALELDGHDKYYYVRAISPGLQEFIEAYGFYKSLKDGTLVTYEELQKDVLTFKVYCDTGYLCGSNKFSAQLSSGRGPGRNRTAGPRSYRRDSTQRRPLPQANVPPSETSDANTQSVATAATADDPGNQTEIPSSRAETANTESPGVAPEARRERSTNLDGLDGQDQAQSQSRQSEPDSDATKTIVLFLPQTDFLLGLCDIPGELMRACIHATAHGNKEYAFSTCAMIQHFYAGCLGVTSSRQLQSKMSTMRASVQKMEVSCYGLSIRDDKKSRSSFFTGNFDDEVHGEDYDSGNE